MVSLQRDNKGKAAELQELQGQLAESKEEIERLESELRKAGEIIEAI